MEPAIELAVRIVSHLWILRQVFPGSSSLANLPLEWPGDLERAAHSDFSLGRRIEDLTPPSSGGPTGWVHRLGPRFLSRDRALPFVHAVAAFAAHLRGIARTGAGEPDRFPADALAFREYDTSEHDVLTRDKITDRLANAMLANPALMRNISAVLEFEPHLVSEVEARATHPVNWTDPAALREAADEAGVPIPFSLAEREELTEIDRSRELRLGIQPDKKPGSPDRLLPHQQAFDRCLFGLAISGGGIRSATFALGILQAMADSRLLGFIDCLSTVSGGGYIGSWLLAWIKRRGSIQSVEDSIRWYAADLKCGDRAGSGGARNSDPMSDDTRPIRHLREYSRYLAPRAGFFSADSWTIASTWLRNTGLNLLVLISALAAVLLAPRAAAFWLLRLPAVAPGPTTLGVAAAAVLFAACVLIAFRNLWTFHGGRPRAAGRCRGDNEPLVVSSILTLIVLGAFLATAALWTKRADGAPFFLLWLFGAVVFCLGSLIISLPSMLNTSDWHAKSGGNIVWVVLNGGIGGLLFGLVGWILSGWIEDSQQGTWMAVTLGVCLTLLAITAVVAVLIGLLGRDLAEEEREWWSRLGAWIGIFTVVWLFVGAVCFFSPLWTAKLGVKLVAAGIPWAAITAAGAKLAYSPKSGANGESQQNPWSALVMFAAPYVFIAGLLVALAFGVNYGLSRLLEWRWLASWFLPDPWAHQLCCTGAPFTFQRMVDNYWPLMYPASAFATALLPMLAGLVLLLSWRIDVNEFSMHNFYKNRLARAYLGASRARQHRWPNAFTGFDMDDDLPLSRLRIADGNRKEDQWTDCGPSFQGPLPILNTALNLSRGENLGNQERKAESFFFTPLRAGFDFTRKQAMSTSDALAEYALRPTAEYAYPEDEGISLGTAMAISGAAANPNAGFHTSPGLAFLLTIFNVRLGRWLGNTRRENWRRSSPRLGLFYLLNELFGLSDSTSSYVALSDGGHFENMGLYELVRRRCRYIVVIDAEEDGNFKLEGIGGAVRKCRVDFGVNIDLDVGKLEPDGKTRLSKTHYAVGTILYPGEERCGTIVYIKSSLTKNVPLDVLEFRKRVPEFPNESTANQFYDESHFESYRKLGHSVGAEIFREDAVDVFHREHRRLCATFDTIFKQKPEPEKKEGAK
jgi:hypothetical protein